jgi:hypothetical protein
VLGGRGRPLGGEKVAEAQGLEPFLFQASQLEPIAALVVHLDQVRWPDVQERLEALDPLLVEQFLLLLDPLSSPVAVVSLVIGPEEKEVVPS